MSTARLRLVEPAVPIIGAPMAGGPSTVDLARAVSEAGGLGFLAGGYLSAQTLAEQIHELRSRCTLPFGVNIFVPPTAQSEPTGLEQYLAEIEHEAESQSASLGVPRLDDDGWEAKLELLLAERPAVASFTFGCPPAQAIERLQAQRISVWVTVTSANEASLAATAGADALILQGIEAGGHRSTFHDQDDCGHGLLALLRIVAARVQIPLIAAGAVTDGAALAAGYAPERAPRR